MSHRATQAWNAAHKDRYSFTVVDLHLLLSAGLCRPTRNQEMAGRGDAERSKR